jgi:hypothetical protein
MEIEMECVEYKGNEWDEIWFSGLTKANGLNGGFGCNSFAIHTEKNRCK